MLRSQLMPTDEILSLLITERDKLTRAIEVLQGTARAHAPRRTVKRTATPAANATTDAEPSPNHGRKRAVWTAAMRRAASVRAKKARMKSGAGGKR